MKSPIIVFVTVTTPISSWFWSALQYSETSPKTKGTTRRGEKNEHG